MLLPAALGMFSTYFNEHQWRNEGTIKLLTIITYYSPHWTGLTTHVVQVAEGLAARGIDVTVLTVRYSPELKRDEVINGVRVIRLQPVARFSRGMITPALLWAAPLLINKHDMVQIHTPLPEGPIIASWCRFYSGRC